MKAFVKDFFLRVQNLSPTISLTQEELDWLKERVFLYDSAQHTISLSKNGDGILQDKKLPRSLRSKLVPGIDRAYFNDFLVALPGIFKDFLEIFSVINQIFGRVLKDDKKNKFSNDDLVPVFIWNFLQFINQNDSLDKNKIAENLKIITSIIKCSDDDEFSWRCAAALTEALKDQDNVLSEYKQDDIEKAGIFSKEFFQAQNITHVDPATQNTADPHKLIKQQNQFEANSFEVNQEKVNKLNKACFKYEEYLLIDVLNADKEFFNYLKDTLRPILYTTSNELGDFVKIYLYGRSNVDISIDIIKIANLNQLIKIIDEYKTVVGSENGTREQVVTAIIPNSNSGNVTDANITKKDSGSSVEYKMKNEKLELARQKYLAVLKCHQALVQPQVANSQRLNNFGEVLASNKEVLVKNRDDYSPYFFRIVGKFFDKIYEGLSAIGIAHRKELAHGSTLSGVGFFERQYTISDGERFVENAEEYVPKPPTSSRSNQPN